MRQRSAIAFYEAGIRLRVPYIFVWLALLPIVFVTEPFMTDGRLIFGPLLVGLEFWWVATALRSSIPEFKGASARVYLASRGVQRTAILTTRWASTALIGALFLALAITSAQFRLRDTRPTARLDAASVATLERWGRTPRMTDAAQQQYDRWKQNGSVPQRWLNFDVELPHLRWHLWLSAAAFFIFGALGFRQREPKKVWIILTPLLEFLLLFIGSGAAWVWDQLRLPPANDWMRLPPACGQFPPLSSSLVCCWRGVTFNP
jgi:hypothetical protein